MDLTTRPAIWRSTFVDLACSKTDLCHLHVFFVFRSKNINLLILHNIFLFWSTLFITYTMNASSSSNNNNNNNPNNNNNSNSKRLKYNEMMRNNRNKMREQERQMAQAKHALEKSYVDLKRQIRQIQAKQLDAHRARMFRAPNVRQSLSYTFNIVTILNLGVFFFQFSWKIKILTFLSINYF